ncbi:MAG: hypothetical protein JSS60_09025 [Verrucomicrobia bacterium]|nr:hypothetical protein [Verrucomicrobiota bacterium]
MLDMPMSYFHSVPAHDESGFYRTVQYQTMEFTISLQGSIFTDREIMAYAESVKALFADGLQWGDIPEVIAQTMMLIEGPLDSYRRELAMAIVDKVIDISDTPILPDYFTDPLFKALSSSLLNFVFDLSEGKVATQYPAMWEVKTSSMTPSPEQTLRFAYQVQAIFNDGFQWSDLTEMIVLGVKFLDQYSGLNELQRKEMAVFILDDIIDITDTPYLPDNVFDPLFKFVVPTFVDFVMELIQSNTPAFRMEKGESRL